MLLNEEKIKAGIQDTLVTHTSASPNNYGQYLVAVRRHTWSVLGLALIAAFVAALVSLTIPSVYKAKSILLIEPPKSKVLSIEDIYGIEKGGGEFFHTQVEILRSRDMAARVIRSLGLEKYPEYSSLIGGGVVSGDDADLDETSMQVLVNAFKSKTYLNTIRQTHLVEIYFEALDPKLAATGANQLAKSYLESNLENQIKVTSDSSNWLIERLGPLKTELVNAEKRLQAYREKENLADVEGVRTLIASELQSITTKLVEATNRRTETEILLKQIRSTKDWETIPTIFNHVLVKDALVTRSKTETRVAELSKRYGPEHPVMLAAQSELEAATRSLKSQMSATVQSIEKEYDAFVAKEQALLEANKRATGEVIKINSKEYQLKELQREVDTRRRLYETFFTRFQETNAIKDFDPVNARVTEHASVPMAPVKPDRKKIVIFTFLLFLLIGAALAIMLERLKSAFRVVDDIEQVLNIPILGLIPYVEFQDRSALNVDKVFAGQDGLNIEEFVHSIRTGLLLSNVDEKKHITLVTSSVPEEGKSIVSGCLSVAVGQLKKVLLVDADMRRPSVHKQFEKLQNVRGLADILAETETLDDCIQHLSEHKVDVLTVGQIPPKPLDLLSSKRFLDLLDELSDRYEHIIIDSPPVHAVSDALVLSRQVDNVIFVIKSDATSHYVARHAMSKLKGVNANILGGVLNQFDPLHSPHTGHYYQYMYKYGN